MTTFAAVVEALSVRDRVSVGIKTSFATVVATVSVRVNVSEIASIIDPALVASSTKVIYS